MKNVLKQFTVLLLVCAVLAVSLPVVQIAPKAEGTSYADVAYETVTFDFEDGEVGFVTDAYDSHQHGNFTLGDTPATVVSNNGMWGISGNKVLKIAKGEAATGKNAENGNMSEFLSPAASVIDAYKNDDTPKYLTSGSFDFYVTADNRDRINQVIVFAQDDVNYVAATPTFYNHSTAAYSNLCTTFFSQALDAERTCGNSQENPSSFAVASGAQTWIHYEFFYNSSNKLTVIMSTADGLSHTVTYDDATITPENRILAFAEAKNNNNRNTLVDNIKLNFASTDAQNDAVIDFCSDQYNKETFELSTDVAPYSFERINTVVQAFDTAKAANKAFEKVVFPTDKINSLKNAVEKWNTETDSAIAESFYNIYISANPDYKIAYNVYRRLSKAQRAAFKTAYSESYNAMMSAIDNSGDDSGSFVISAVGEGYRNNIVQDATATNWYNIFDGDENINATYTLYGVKNAKILSDAATNNSSVLNGGFRSSYEYYRSIVINAKKTINSVTNQLTPDMIVIMLGSNDFVNGIADENGFVDAEKYAQLKAVYTDLVQSYLALDCNPQVVISTNVDTKNVVEGCENYSNALFGLLKEIATEYDIPLFNTYEYTSSEDFATTNYQDNYNLTAAGLKTVGSFFVTSLKNFTNNDFNSAFYLTHTHTGGTATCSVLKECTLCHNSYGDYDNVHNLESTVSCAEDNSGHGYKCTWCGQIPTLSDHVYDTEYSETNSDNDKHWHVCNVCHYEDKANGEAHTPNVENPDAFTIQYCTGCGKILKTGDTYVNDFEDDNNQFVVESDWNKHVHTSTGTYSVSNDYKVDGSYSGFVPDSKGDNHVGKINSPIVTGLSNGDLSNFYSPEKSVFDTYAESGKYLSSGSFDINLGRSAVYTHSFVFGLNTENVYTVTGADYSGYTYWTETVSSISTASQTNGGKNNPRLYSSEGNKNYRWVHCEFMFNTDNKLVLVVSDNSGVGSLITFGNAISPEDRIFAFAVRYENNIKDFDLCFDNVVLNFAKNGVANQTAIDYYSDNSVVNASLLSADTLVPSEISNFADAIANYNTVASNVNVKYNTPYTNTINAVIEQSANWNTTNYKTVAQSFIEIYGSNLTSPETYTVFRRLSKQVRAYIKSDYTTQYELMYNAVTGSAADNSLNIALLGDDIFYAEKSAATARISTLLSSALSDENYVITDYSYKDSRLIDGSKKDKYLYSQFQNDDYKTKKLFDAMRTKQDVIFVSFGGYDMYQSNFYNENIMTAYLDLVNKLLCNPNNPEIVLCTIPEIVITESTTGNPLTCYKRKESYIKSYNDVIKTISDEYGLPILDIYQLSQGFTAEDFYYSDGTGIGTSYAWNLSASGAAKLTALIKNTVTSADIVNTESGCIANFENSETLSPNLLGATISDTAALTGAGTRDLYFRYSLPTNLDDGVTITEHGVIATYDQYIMKRFNVVTEKEDLSVLNAAVTLGDGETAPAYTNAYVIKVVGESNPFSDGNYAAAVSIPSSYYGTRVIARAYVVLSDGRVYYSCNNTSDTLSQISSDGTQGVVNGFAVRSISGITMNIARFVVSQGINTDAFNALKDADNNGMNYYVAITEINNGAAGMITGWSSTYLDALQSNNTNGDAFVVFIASNQSKINEIIEAAQSNGMPGTQEPESGFENDKGFVS